LIFAGRDDRDLTPARNAWHRAATIEIRPPRATPACKAWHRAATIEI
jgi:hypothetical protein